MSTQQDYANSLFERYTQRMHEADVVSQKVIGQTITLDNMDVLHERMGRLKMYLDSAAGIWNLYSDYCEARNLPIRDPKLVSA